MATYIPGSASELDSLDSIKKVQEYLIKQERKLDYMFNNLAPEDNYSEQARLTMVTDGQRQATIEAALDGIKLNYVSKDGIVSAENLEQAVERCGTKQGNKGFSAMQSAIEMANVVKQLG